MFKGQPKGLYALALANTGERFGYYTMLAVFMGDTGSLFFGGAVVGMTFLINDPLIIVIVGIIYILEALSDIIQVGVFKITRKIYGEGRRVFKMAPFHHHLEMCGWSEWKIVIVASSLTAVLCLLSLLA